MAGPVVRPRRCLPNDVLKLSSARVSRLKGVHSLRNVRSLRHSGTLGAEATGGLASDQRTSAIPESPARFRRRVILLGFDRNAVLEIMC
jgi:hypothetical protein